MKKIKLIIWGGLLLAGCNKFKDEINTNPNLPSEASATQLIANAELSLPGISSQPQGEYYAQYLSETQYPNLSLYNQVSHSFYGWYTGPLMNLETVITSEKLDGNEGPVANQKAVAKILKAYFLWHMTDRWGDLPLSQSLKGDENYSPVYDTQQSVYETLFSLLDEANSEIVAGNIDNDIMYDGDMEQWKKFGNTIHMLMALRLSKVDATKGAAEFNKALNAGIMQANADNFTFRHLEEEANQNYWYGQVYGLNREWWALSETLVNTMKPVNDPRLPVYGDPNTVGEYVGLEYGKLDGIDEVDFSLLGSAIWEQDAPVYLVTYAQALFAEAEAAKLGWIPGGDAVAAEHYNNAIENSVRQWTGSNTGVTEFLAQPGIQYEAANALKQIATQRWVHLFMHGYEAWNEWRRTGFPELTEPGGTAVPRRQGYPTEEQFLNKDNYNEAINRQFGGTDDLNSRIWWDE